MLEFFQNPPNEYRPTPFWFWNSKLNKDEIERQIREMHSKGVGGFFVHGRFGLKTEYMSDEWMGCIEHACLIAKELGMYVWLYDENPFPSGVGGGEVMKDIRHHNKFLDYTRMTVEPGASVDLPLDSEKLLSASVINEESNETIDLIRSAPNGRIEWTVPEGKGSWEIIIIHARTAFNKSFIYGSEPDYFEPTMMPAYLRHTHERYATHLEEYFGDPIVGIFTDEPKMQCVYHMHDDANTSPWFDELPQEFLKDHGYDLMPNLSALFADVGGDPGKIRRDYWSTLAKGYAARYFEPYRRWCERNNLVFTGHLFLEEGLYANTMYQGNYPGILREFNMPGVDHLATSIDSEYKIPHVPTSITRTHGNKIATSGAHITGSNRILSETFGCCGWGLTMEEMKWIVDWQFTLGVNFLCPHAFYYSIAGARKTDAPPSQFYQARFWPHYKLFADYVGRLSYALSQGRHSAQIALLYPLSSFQSEWTPGRLRSKDKLIAAFFDAYCKHLMTQHLDYDVITEADLAEAHVENGKLIIGNESFELLILPPMTVIEDAAASVIKDFAASGGKLLGSVILPAKTTNGDNIDQLFENIFNNNSLTYLFNEPDPAVMASLLRKTVERLISPDVSILTQEECKDINYIRRTTSTTDIFFFANGASEQRKTRITLRNCATSDAQVWSLETGQATPLKEYLRSGDELAFDWTFEPRGSLLITASTKAIEEHLEPLPAEDWISIPIELDDEWTFTTEEPNVHILRDWELSVRTLETRLEYLYKKSIPLSFIPDRLWLLLDDMPPAGEDTGNASSRCRVFVNGQEALSESGEWYVDNQFQKLDIRPFVTAGDNEICIRIDHEGWAGEPKLMNSEPRLVGDFSLEQENGSWIITLPKTTINSGSWSDNGYPFFSGTAHYTQKVEFTNVVPGGKVILNIEDAADMVEVWINGYRAAVRPWRPFSADISDLVTEGENLVTISVINSLQNMLLGEPKKSGLLGKVTIEAAWHAPEAEDEDKGTTTDTSKN